MEKGKGGKRKWKRENGGEVSAPARILQYWTGEAGGKTEQRTGN